MLPPPYPAVTIQRPAADLNEITPLTQDLVKISYRVARRTFRGSRCAGRIKLEANLPEPQMTFGGVVAFGGAAPDCVIKMAPMVFPETFCFVFVHEYGHHALTRSDADHTNPIADGVMLRETYDFKPCDRAMRGYTIRLERRQKARSRAAHAKLRKEIR